MRLFYRIRYVLKHNMRRQIACVFMCSMVWLAIFLYSRRTKGRIAVVSTTFTTGNTLAVLHETTSAPDTSNEYVTPQILSSISEDEKYEDDETEKDNDKEDFDLICNGNVPPVRIKEAPRAIIIGAKKGGSRALIEFLKLHPKIKAAIHEIHYFDRHYNKSMEWYISRMKQIVPNSGEIAIEKTPGYFHMPEAPKRMYEMLPSVKLILILRDPVDRLISDYNQFRWKHLSQGKAYPTLEEFVFTADNSVDTEYPVLQRSIYHVYMSRWMMYFSLGQIHIVHGEKFMESPWSELNKSIFGLIKRPLKV